MDISGDYASKWWSTFWWVRGVVAAMTLTTLVPSFTELSRIQFLKVFQLAFQNWDRVASFLGSIVGRLPLVPEVPAWVVNAVLFSMSICLPACYGFFARSGISNVDLTEVRATLFSSVQRPWSRSKSKEALLSVYPVFPETFYWTIAIVIVPFFLFSPYRIIFSDNTIIPVWIHILTISFFGLVCVFIVLIGVFAIPRFAKAFFLLLSFLVTIELLYLANTPVLADWVDRAHCLQLDPSASVCGRFN